MLARLKEETRAHHANADTDRLAPLATEPSLATYVSYLTRVYGFEAPLEKELARTPELAALIDARSCARSALIATDLRVLGVSPTNLERLPEASIPAFVSPAQGLGWMYVLERNMLPSSILRRHLMRRMPERLVGASTYLASCEGLVGHRWRALGEALDELGRTPSQATRIVDAACTGFRIQHLWLRGLRSLDAAAASR